jgi:hypothetical protein
MVFIRIEVGGIIWGVELRDFIWCGVEIFPPTERLKTMVCDDMQLAFLMHFEDIFVQDIAKLP